MHQEAYTIVDEIFELFVTNNHPELHKMEINTVKPIDNFPDGVDDMGLFKIYHIAKLQESPDDTIMYIFFSKRFNRVYTTYYNNE